MFAEERRAQHLYSNSEAAEIYDKSVFWFVYYMEVMGFLHRNKHKEIMPDQRLIDHNFVKFVAHTEEDGSFWIYWYWTQKSFRFLDRFIEETKKHGWYDTKVERCKGGVKVIRAE